MKKLLTLTMIIVFPIIILAQTIVPGGNVDGTWTQSGSPYLINGDITVLNGMTLIIQPGVNVVFQDYFTFFVDGTINANGTLNDSIVFTVADTTGYYNATHVGWGGIKANFTISSVNLSFCIIEFSKTSGIYIDDISSFIIENNHLRYNHIGLSLYRMPAQINHIKCTKNEIGVNINNYSGDNVTLNYFDLSYNKRNGIKTYQAQGCHFYGNHGEIKNNGSSGVFVNSYLDDAYFYLSDVIIEGNGNDTTNGGGILAYNYVSLQNVKISNNRALNGGGIYSYGAGYVITVSDLNLDNSVVKNNIAVDKGGGIYYNGYYLRLQNSLISGNSANDGGGAHIRAGLGKTVLNSQTSLVLKNLEVSQNNAANYGGGIYFSFYGPIGIAGIGYRNITHISIVDNVANNEGSGIYNSSNLDPILLPINVNNSIIWDDGTNALVDTYSNFQIDYSNIKGSWPGTGNVNTNPIFVNPSNGNFKLSWINYPAIDYTKSPCIDTGDPLTVNDPDGTVADMGAYYFDHNSQNQASIDITVFLEGPFINNQMATSLNTLGYLPLNQPYIGSPWKHYGTESVTSIPNVDIVDWVLVEIRKLNNPFNPDNYNTESRQAAFLLTNGQIKGLNGSDIINFHTSENDSLYICIFHRNHLPLISANSINTGVNPINYDFSTGSEMAMGGEHVQNQLSSSIWGMIASDGNKDSQIENKDKNDAWLTKTGNIGYYFEDYNMDGTVDFSDIQLWKGNTGKGNPVYQTNFPYKCGLPFLDERDGKVYSTVQIGNQCWMAQNLNYGTGTGSCYNYQQENCDIYGKLYFHSPNQQSVCPNGWHVPSIGEWQATINVLGGNSVAGGKMKSTGTYPSGNGLWNEPNFGATNESGFSALPGGYSYMNYQGLHLAGYFRTSTISPYNYQDVYFIRLHYEQTSANYYFVEKLDPVKYSIRCIKDGYNINFPPILPSNPLPNNEANNQSINTTLNWNCYEPEGDPLTFDIYFGATNPPSLLISGHTGITYNPGTLLNSTTYYWMIVAHDDQGNSTTGFIWSFTTASAPSWNCGDQLVDIRDGQSYPTTLIGAQCWMAKNLNIGTMINASQSQVNNTPNEIIEKYCYNNNSSNCTIYGGLYQWNEAMQYSTQQGVQGICPSGWHLPTNAELLTITNLLGGDELAGGPLKQTGTLENGTGLWHTPNAGATNSTQFTGLPAGYSKWDNTFYSLGYYSHFWSSYQTSSTNANLRTLFADWPDFMLNNYSKDFGFSVRCVKN
jgi:uncharacterized protein (TIGR02145 family)